MGARELPDLIACLEAKARNDGIDPEKARYVKVSRDLLDLISQCETQGQRDRLAGLIIADACGAPVDVDEVPKTLRGFFIVARNISNRIWNGFRTGGKRRNGPEIAEEDAATTRPLVGDYSPASRGLVGDYSSTSQPVGKHLAAETPTDPPRVPNTPYTKTDTETQPPYPPF